MLALDRLPGRRYWGPNRYTGREMRAAHAHLGITSQAFDRVATHLLDTLIDLGVADQDRASVLAAVAPLKPLIIHQPTTSGAGAE